MNQTMMNTMSANNAMMASQNIQNMQNQALMNNLSVMNNANSASTVQESKPYCDVKNDGSDAAFWIVIVVCCVMILVGIIVNFDSKVDY